MEHAFDVFQAHGRIMDDYRSFVRSHVSILADDIRKTVEEQIESGFYWPEPLIQFNPAYHLGGTAKELCDEGLIHPEISRIFRDFRLFRHQVEAITLGSNGRDFVVTSGTGSGKSLTYIGTIFNYLLKQHDTSPSGIHKGIKAIIVYPMNALINSQLEALQHFKKDYEQFTGKQFPISFARYTGQEDVEARDQVKDRQEYIMALAKGYDDLRAKLGHNEEA